MINYKELSVFVENPEPYVLSALETFKETIKKNGSDSFVPMCIYLGSSGEIKLSILSRPWTDKDDMYKSFSEMLFAYVALDAHCCIFINDVRVTKYNSKEPHSKTMQSQDALNISLVSKESSAVITIPYSIKEDNNVLWDMENAVTSPLSKEDPTEVYQGDMVELFYVMSHIDNSPFTTAQLLNYYNAKGFKYQVSEDSLIDKVTIEAEKNDNIN